MAQIMWKLYELQLLTRGDEIQKAIAFRKANTIGADFGWEGWLSHEQYELGKELMQRFKEEFLEEMGSTEE